MIYDVQVWEYPTDEEGGEHEMVESEQFDEQAEARYWAWERLEEGFAVRMYRR